VLEIAVCPLVRDWYLLRGAQLPNYVTGALNDVCAQDPKVTILETYPLTNEKGVIRAKQDDDVTMDCYVENLPRNHQVMTNHNATNLNHLLST
jgi:hypothetical protein